jgi:hypothetical protein
MTLGELATFIRDGWFFDEPVCFEPAIEGAWASEPRWRSVELHYSEGRRPVLIEHLFEAERVSEEVREALEALQGNGLSERYANLVRSIRDCQQVFLFEVDSAGATEACWMMLDATEAFLARSRGGVIFVAGEGFYDAALQPIRKV